MRRETEAKIRVDSHGPLRAHLRELGATFVSRVVETNRILDRPDASLRRRGCGLRIRSAVAEVGDDVPATLTGKGPVVPGPFKSREEIELRIDDADAAADLLHLLGFVVILRYRKRRESWRLGDCRIELDEPPHLGLFVEIEGPDEAAIQSTRDALGLGDAPVERASYVRMLLAYCDEHGVTDHSLLEGV